MLQPSGGDLSSIEVQQLQLLHTGKVFQTLIAYIKAIVQREIFKIGEIGEVVLAHTHITDVVVSEKMPCVVSTGVEFGASGADLDEFRARVKDKIEAADGDVSFYEAKVMTARFYFERILPRTRAHKKSMLSGPDNLMTMPEAMFDF